MKKSKYVYFSILFTGYTLAIFFAVGAMLINKSNNPSPKIIYSDKQFDPLFRMPLIVEKEVVVYVEKEVLVTADEPPVVYYDQPLDYNFDIMIPSGYTREELHRSLGGIRDGMESSIDAIVTAEEIYGVNSLYLLAMLGFESGWGTVESGINNIAGWKGTEDNTWSNFNSRYECIMEVANGLANDFSLDVGPRIYDIAARYTPDEGYVDTLLQIMSELKNNI